MYRSDFFTLLKFAVEEAARGWRSSCVARFAKCLRVQSKRP